MCDIDLQSRCGKHMGWGSAVEGEAEHAYARILLSCHGACHLPPAFPPSNKLFCGDPLHISLPFAKFGMRRNRYICISQSEYIVK
jgi:hypothetical protein